MHPPFDDSCDRVQIPIKRLQNNSKSTEFGAPSADLPRSAVGDLPSERIISAIVPRCCQGNQQQHVCVCVFPFVEFWKGRETSSIQRYFQNPLLNGGGWSRPTVAILKRGERGDQKGGSSEWFQLMRIIVFLLCGLSRSRRPDYRFWGAGTAWCLHIGFNAGICCRVFDGRVQ